MTLTFDEDTKLLTRLGLTELQAQVYLTLAKMGKATLREISAASKADRANVYRVITRLLELNLIEKLLSTPTVFRALPLADGIRMLLEKKDQEHNDIKAKSRELLLRYQKVSIDSANDEDASEFILIPDGRLTKRKVAEMINSNQKSHDILIYWADFKAQAKAVAAMWLKVLVRGVKVRILVFMEKNEKLPKSILCLRSYPQFEIRKAATPPKATLSIIDGKETFISVSPSLSPRGKPGLYVNNHGVVGLVQEYFELAWRNAEAVC